MGRTVADAATVLGALVGVDPRDEATQASLGKGYSDYTRFLDADGVALLRLDRPQARNAMNTQMLAEMLEHLAVARADDEVRALVISSTDHMGLSAGADVKERLDEEGKVRRMQLFADDNKLSREEALRLWTVGSAWFSQEEDVKGRIAPGQYADFAVLSEDYFTVPEEQIKNIESVMTVVGGKVVYAAKPFEDVAPPALPPVSPAWSPVAHFGGYQNQKAESP